MSNILKLNATNESKAFTFFNCEIDQNGIGGLNLIELYTRNNKKIKN